MSHPGAFTTHRAKPAVYATRDIAAAVARNAAEPVSSIGFGVFAIAPLTPAHLDDSERIFRHGLGDGFITRDDLATYIDNDEKAAFVAVAGHHIIGVVTADNTGAASHLPADAARRIAHVTRGRAGDLNQLGLLRSVAVSPTARARGVGSALVTTAVSALRNRRVLSVGWIDDKGCHVQRALESARFKDVGDLHDFWTADSKLNGYTCPTCGHPCRCAARIFLREV